MAEADPLLHEWFEVEDTEFKRRFELHKGRIIQKPWELDWSFLRNYGIGDEFEGYLTPPWKKLFTLSPPYYPELALEFVSSFIIHDADKPYDRSTSISFRLGGRPHRISVQLFAVYTGLYEEDVVSDLFLNAFTIKKPDPKYTSNEIELWERIAHPRYYAASRAKTKYIVNPAHRLLQKCICKTVALRDHSEAVCNKADMFYLHCLIDRVPCNLALSLARLFHSYGTKSHPSVVFGAAIVRNIANALHISFDGLTEVMDFEKWDKTWLISNHVIEAETTRVHEVEAAVTVKDLEKNVPKTSHYLENSRDYRNPEYCQNNPKDFSNLNQVAITKNLQASQYTEKDAPCEVGLQTNCDTTRSHEYEVGNEENGGNIKRSRTSEEGDYSVHSDPETPNSGGSDASGNKGKGNVSQSSWYLNEIGADLRAMMVTRDHEVGNEENGDTTRSREYEVGNEENGGNIKRSRTSEEGDYSVHSDPETPNSGGSDASGNKGKGNVSQSSWYLNEIGADLRAMMVTRDHEVGNEENGDTTSSREYEVGNEENGGNIKRSRTSEEGDYSVHSDPETPNSGGSDASGNKGKGNVSQSSWSLNEIGADLRAMMVTRDHEVEVMKQRVELMKKRLELEQIREIKREERNTKKGYYMHLNTLFAKEHLSPEDEDIKRRLVAMLYGK